MMKKTISILLALCLCMSVLSACGGGSDSAAGEAASDHSNEAAKADNASTETGHQNSVEIEPEVVEPADPPESTDDSKELSGILIAVWDCRSKTKRSVEIVSIDPETGEEKTISSFMFDNCSSATYQRYATDKEMFSSDLKKAAATMSIGNKGYYCAGWLDENGNFYNVTEALGLLPTSDFSDGCYYHAVGFIGNYFVYLDNPFIDPKQVQYYAVPIDNIALENVIELTVDMDEFVPSSVRELSNSNKLWVGRWDTFRPSDILDDGRVIAGENIINPTTGEKTSYIPGGNRTNWDGMVNPSNDKICFLSMYNASDETGLYIVDISGGDPVKVNCSLPSSVKYNSYSGIAYEIATQPVIDTVICSIIDWL